MTLNFGQKYFNFVKSKYIRFAKYYYPFIFSYNVLVNFLIKDEAKNVLYNKVCIETIPYKVLFPFEFPSKICKSYYLIILCKWNLIENISITFDPLY